jgi:hypothetical protein
MPWFEFKFRIFSWFYYSLSCVENRVYLSHGVYVIGAT